MRNSRLLVIAATIVMVISACTAAATPSPSVAPATAPPSAVASSAAPSSAAPSSAAPSVALPSVKIGSDNFYESKLMAEIYSQILEHAGYTVDRHFGLGSRQARQPLVEQGQVDIVPEYIGSGLGYYDKTAPTGDPQKNHDALAAILKTKGGGMELFGFTPAQDQNAAVVRPDTASALKLTKMSDLAAVQDQLKWGLPPDCDTNPLCKGALESYGITYPPKKRVALAACDSPIAQALQAKTIDFAWLCSTQPAIVTFGFTLLTDDKQTQPADNLAPIVRDDFLAKVPDKTAFQKLFDDASAKMDTATLTQLGVDVAVNNKDIAVVAKDWLTKNGLLP